MKIILLVLCSIFNEKFNVYSNQIDLGEVLRMESLFCKGHRYCFAEKYKADDPVSAPYMSLIPIAISKGFKRNCCETRCSCDLDSCIAEDTCCPDADDKWPTFFQSKVKLFCMYPQLRPYSKLYPNSNTTVQIYKRCPESFDAGSEIFHKCESEELMDKPDTFVPVTDKKNGVTYKNRYCALCHNRSETDFINWRARTECFKFKGTSGPPNSFHEVFETKECNVLFERPFPMVLGGMHCPLVIKECNVTGLWKTYEPLLEMACLSYTRIFNLNYNNVFCYLCNTGDTVSPKVCKVNDHIVNFSDLLKVKDIKPTPDVCGPNKIHDPVKKICYEIMCKFPKKLQDGKCVYHTEYIGGITYVLVLKLIPSDIIQLSDTIVDKIEETFRDWLTEKIGAVSSVYLEIKAKINSSNETSENITHFIIDVRVTCDVFPPSKTDIIDYMLSVKDVSMETFVSGNLVNYTMVLLAYENGLNPSLYDPTPGHTKLVFKDDYQQRFPHIYLDLLYACPFVRLNRSIYFIEREQQVVTIAILNAAINTYSVVLQGEHNEISHLFMCIQTYKDVMSPFIEYNFCDEKVSFQSILSLICISLSLAFALVTLFFYLRFKRLKHTQPGINNIILCIALVVAQVLFQSGDPCIISKEACKIMGIFIHFSWLFLIFWMNICCIHMVRVFRLSQIRQTFYNTSKTTFIYFLYSFSASLILVIANIIAALNRSKGIDIGYGGATCYINDRSMIAYAFALPVAAIVVINIILFIVVMAQLRNVPKIQSDNDNRNFVHIYARLSTLTGGTWLFGFASFFLNVDALDYIFLLLNAPQGLFLFFAFVANKRSIKSLLKRDPDDRAISTMTSTYKHG